MRKILFILFMLVFARGFSQAVMLFPEYEKGVVYLRNNQRVNVHLNYDATNRQMMYQQDGQNMILTNVEAVVKVHIGKRMFQPLESGFCEVVTLEGKALLIDWRLENIHIGYRGAYGQVSQVRSHSVQLYSITGHSHEVANTVSDMDVYKLKSRNVYYFYDKNKQKKFKDKKSLLKLFPESQKQILQYITEMDIDFSQAEDVIRLMEKVFLL